MLYLTTRTPNDTYTPARVLAEDRSPDGGFFVPMRLPVLDKDQLKRLSSNSFSETVADIINLLFGTNLDGWSVEFAIGRYPVKTCLIGSREIVAEMWHNPVWKFDRLVRGIEKAIRQSDDVRDIPSDFLMIGARMAVLFGIFADLMGQGRVSRDEPMDIACPSGNFSGVMAAWYAKQMGLPIGTVLCCCNDNNGVWNLLHKGQVRTDAQPVQTPTPQCDTVVPEGLERLIFASLGIKAANSFAQIYRNGGTFYLEPEQQTKLRDGIYVPVTGNKRLESAVKSLYHSCGYPADVYTAMCYSGILDYRSVTGESRPVLILSDESPVYSLPYLAKCLKTTPNELKKRIDEQR